MVDRSSTATYLRSMSFDGAFPFCKSRFTLATAFYYFPASEILDLNDTKKVRATTTEQNKCWSEMLELQIL